MVSPENVVVDPAVVAALPDPGHYLLDLLASLHGDSRRALAAEINRVRHPNGSIPRANLSGIGVRDWRCGPLTLLVALTVRDVIACEVWSSSGLTGPEKRRISHTVTVVAREQGVPAAATWALRSRPNGRLDLGSLAAQLTESWQEQTRLIRNDDVVKSFTRWRLRA